MNLGLQNYTLPKQLFITDPYSAEFLKIYLLL